MRIYFYNKFLVFKRVIIGRAVRKNKDVHILLVEDSHIVRLVHQKILLDMNYKLDIAIDGEQAVIMEKQGYDVILMDMGLPKMNGIEATLKIRESKIGKTRNAIGALTAYSPEEVEKKCLAAGMNAVLQKPIDARALRKAIEKMLKLNAKNELIGMI